MPRWNVVATDGASPGLADTKGYIELLGLWSAASGSGAFRVDDLGNTTVNTLTVNGGVNTSGSVPVISSPGFSSGVASQLSDLTRDYMVYFRIATGGGTISLAIGPTSSPANTIMSSATGVNGELISVRLPAGWYLEITLATSTIGSQIAIGC